MGLARGGVCRGRTSGDGGTANSDTQQFRNGIVSDLGGMSLVTWQRGTLTAVVLAMFCIQLDFSP